MFLKYAIVFCLLFNSGSLYSFEESIDYLKISTIAANTLPILGFAAILIKSDFVNHRHETPLILNGREIGVGYLTKRDAEHLGTSLLGLWCSFAHINLYKEHVKQRRPAFGRERKVFVLPDIVDPREFNSGALYNSFPSSHATAMFFGASTIHKEFGFKVASPFYLVSAICSGMRVYRDRHYIHDVIAGAMLGSKLALSRDFVNFIPTLMNNDGAVTVNFKY